MRSSRKVIRVMARYCFLLRVRPDRMDEYRRRHAAVWPEMLAAMAGTDVNARWQAEMAPFFVGLEGGGPDEGLVVLEEVFHLEDQLRKHAGFD
jgi:L-rhamnose mutarotase